MGVFNGNKDASKGGEDMEKKALARMIQDGYNSAVANPQGWADALERACGSGWRWRGTLCIESKCVIGGGAAELEVTESTISHFPKTAFTYLHKVALRGKQGKPYSVLPF